MFFLPVERLVSLLQQAVEDFHGRELVLLNPHLDDNANIVFSYEARLERPDHWDILTGTVTIDYGKKSKITFTKDQSGYPIMYWKNYYRDREIVKWATQIVIELFM